MRGLEPVGCGAATVGAGVLVAGAAGVLVAGAAGVLVARDAALATVTLLTTASS